MAGFKGLKSASGLAAIVIFAAAGIFFFGSSAWESDLGVRGNASFSLWLNGKRVEDKRGPVRCGSGDFIKLGTAGHDSLYYCILCQDDGGPITALSGGRAGELASQSILLDNNWRKKTLFCVLSEKNYSFLEAATLVNRFLRKELSRQRPVIEVFYLINRS